DHVAFSGDDLEGIAGRRRRAGRWTASGSALTARLCEEGRLELLVVGHLVVFGALLERRVVLLVAGIGQCHARFSGGAEEVDGDFLIGFELCRRRGAAGRRVGLNRRGWSRRLTKDRRGNEKQNECDAFHECVSSSG